VTTPKKLTFATTNKGKLQEASRFLGIEVEGCGLEVDEIQSLDPEKVAIKKGVAYFEKLNNPILVEDVALTFHAFGKLPGTYINDFFQVLGNKGLTDLLHTMSSRKATALTTLVFIENKNEFHVFTGIVDGEIANEPRGNNGFGWDPIFKPDGSQQTFAEMGEVEKSKYSMRSKALVKFKAWLDNR